MNKMTKNLVIHFKPFGLPLGHPLVERYMFWLLVAFRTNKVFLVFFGVHLSRFFNGVLLA